MNAVDTNVLVYVHDLRVPAKKAVARKLIDNLQDGLLLWQVACEYVSASRKLKPPGYTPKDARRDIDDLRRIWTTALPNWAVFERSADVVDRYGLSYWDALLVAASLETGLQTLYSEDFSGQKKIDGLKIVNPFAGLE